MENEKTIDSRCPVNSLNCPSDESLRNYLAGRLPGREAELAKRVADCSSCKFRIQEFTNTKTHHPLDETTKNHHDSNPSSNVFQPSLTRKHAELFAGDYELLEELGAGGMGVVCKAHQKSLDRIVAIKCIRNQGPVEPSDVARFENEVKALARLDHPGIIQICGSGYYDGHYFYTMQYVQGTTLEVSLARNETEIKDAVSLIIKVASAIAHAHHHGVVHRDLKPSNIMVDSRTKEPKVVDFGLAKHLNKKQHLTNSRAVLGTPVFMPPEQASGNVGEVNERSDVFSIGAVLYAIIAGRSAFCPKEDGNTLRAIAEHRADPPSLFNPRIDKDLDAICLKCLAHESHERYASPLELQRDLKDYLDGKPVSANPRSVIGAVWKRYTADSHFMLMVAGILQVIIAAAFVIWGVCGIVALGVIETPEGMNVRNYVIELLLFMSAFYLPLGFLGVLSVMNYAWASKISLVYWFAAIAICAIFMLPAETLERFSLMQISAFNVLTQFARMQLCCLIGVISSFCAATHLIPVVNQRIQAKKLKTVASKFSLAKK